jgi:hypothetical protein
LSKASSRNSKALSKGLSRSFDPFLSYLVSSLEELLRSDVVQENYLDHRQKLLRVDEVQPLSTATAAGVVSIPQCNDPRALYLKFYRDGQIQILQELLSDLEETIQGAVEEEEE